MSEQDQCVVDISEFNRLQEILEYAEGLGISVQEAAEHLVNSGLSHRRQ